MAEAIKKLQSAVNTNEANSGNFFKPKSINGQQSYKKIKGACYNCGKPGHKAVDCRKPQQQNYSGQNNNKSFKQNTASPPSACPACGQ